MELEIANGFAPPFSIELPEKPDFALSYDLYAAGMDVMRESCERETQLLNTRGRQLTIGGALLTRKDPKLKLRRCVGQEITDSDYRMIVRFHGSRFRVSSLKLEV